MRSQFTISLHNALHEFQNMAVRPLIPQKQDTKTAQFFFKSNKDLTFLIKNTWGTLHWHFWLVVSVMNTVILGGPARVYANAAASGSQKMNLGARPLEEKLILLRKFKNVGLQGDTYFCWCVVILRHISTVWYFRKKVGSLVSSRRKSRDNGTVSSKVFQWMLPWIQPCTTAVILGNLLPLHLL